MVVAGAILAGGRSVRMGTTKALVPINGVPMGRLVADALSGASCSPVVLIGGDADELDALGLRCVPDVVQGGRGPVAGVHSALVSLGEESDAVVVVACDLPALTVHAVSQLIEAFHSGASADVVVAVGDRREPACALWSPTVHNVLADALADGNPSLHSVICSLDRVIEVAIPTEMLRNVNTPSDLPR